MPRAKLVAARAAGPDHQVASLSGGNSSYRREPCGECPFRLDAPIGTFPAEAYRHSAETAYDMSTTQFACHMTGAEKPATCAGFLLVGAEHNLSARLSKSHGKIGNDVRSDVPLYDSYRAMAVANGVDPNDPVLVNCR